MWLVSDQRDAAGLVAFAWLAKADLGMPEISRGAAGLISLPKPLTSFIGRERELAQAKQLLADSYLVTLTGPGGSGKTRLCIAVAAEVAGDYPDGVYFVPLAPAGILTWCRRRSCRA